MLKRQPTTNQPTEEYDPNQLGDDAWEEGGDEPKESSTSVGKVDAVTSSMTALSVKVDGASPSPSAPSSAVASASASASPSSPATTTSDEDDLKNAPDHSLFAGLGFQRQQSYVIVEPADLAARQDTLIKQMSDLLFVTPHEAGMLLRHYGWKANKLEQDWFQDRAAVRKKTGLTEMTQPPKGEEMKNKKYTKCESAFCDEPIDEGAALNCGHFFCGPCWEAYLTSQIQSGRTCIFATCMGMKCTLNHAHKFGCACNEMVPETIVKRYIKDSALLGKYQRWLMESFVEGQHTSIRWCPNPKCTNAVEYRSGGSKVINCRCGFSFCFACSLQAHAPVPCDLVKRWLAKEQSDDATGVWLQARTKTCPKCKVHIEKNKACNHMTCANCKHQFCWLCKGDWSAHGSQTGGNYVCNKYNEDVSKGNLSSEEKAIQSNQKLLQKYSYYYKHYKNCVESLKLTDKVKASLEKKITETDPAATGFLAEAVNKLREARQVLQWAWVMGYYLKTDKHKALFEYHLALLFGNTEHLQDIMENTEVTGLVKSKKEIMNKTRVMDKFRAELVKQAESDEFQAIVLNEADAQTTMWTCAHCKTDNKPETDLCVSCQACAKHGEQECKACAKK